MLLTKDEIVKATHRVLQRYRRGELSLVETKIALQNIGWSKELLLKVMDKGTRPSS